MPILFLPNFDTLVSIILLLNVKPVVSSVISMSEHLHRSANDIEREARRMRMVENIPTLLMMRNCW